MARLVNKAETAGGSSAFIPGTKQPQLMNSSPSQGTVVVSKVEQEREEPEPAHHPAGFGMSDTVAPGSVAL